MLASAVLTKARKLANDTDTSDPLHSDSELYAILSDWLQEVAMEYGYPRKQDEVSYAVGEGGAADADNIDIDIQSILLVVYETTTGANFILTPRTEAEMAAQDPDWRDAAQGQPAHYIVQDAITAGTNQLGPQRTITTDRPVSVAGTMRIYALQIPAVLTAGTNSPVYSAALHKSAEYYTAAHMIMPRDERRANFYLDLHIKKLRRCKTLLHQNLDPNTPIWDRVDGGDLTADRLSR